MIGNVLRLFIFNNSCATCKRELPFMSEKICRPCLKNLTLIASMKERGSSRFIWYLNSYTSTLYKLYRYRRGSVYRSLNNIIFNKYNLSIDMPFYSRRERV